MAQGNPLPGEKYLHFKNRMYQVMAVAYHSETMEKCVVYQALYGDFKTYVRPYDMFTSEVDHEKYPEVEQKYRFQFVEVGERAPDAKKDVKRVVSDADTEGKRAPDARKDAKQVVSDADTPVKPSDTNDGVAAANPWLDKVLDADGYEEKYNIVCNMRGEVTDKLIDDIATVLDFSIPEGDVEERYEQLKYCIRTRQRYESERFR